MQWCIRTANQHETVSAGGGAALQNLLAVEQSFLAAKTLLATRPVFHRTDAAIRGHIGCTFLALLLRKELLDRLIARGAPMPEWQQIIDDLLDLGIVEVEQDGRRAILRTAPRPRSDLPRDRAHIAAQGDADRPDNPRSRLIGVVPKNLMH